jgi:hypothetical protein
MNAMLVSSLTPDNLWDKAILSVCHLQNRIHNQKSYLTPYKLWKGYSYNLKYLKA